MVMVMVMVIVMINEGYQVSHSRLYGEIIKGGFTLGIVVNNTMTMMIDDDDDDGDSDGDGDSDDYGKNSDEK
jgi:hypothetical protein